MLIQAPCIVSLTWQLSDAQGETIDELKAPVEFFFGGSDLLPKVEEVLAGQVAGYETMLQLEPEHAFGDYDADLVCYEERSLFPEQLAPGMQFEGLPEGSTTPDMPQDMVYTVTDVYPSHVVLDGNHPLAGIALRLQIKVENVRKATEEEIEAGTVGDAEFTVLNTVPSVPHLH